ncbi:MAG: hypothetical protein ABIQ89_03535 [Candidatus Saccharimonadales bacterium]
MAMKSNISFIKGSIGIPHNGVLRCDDTTLTLEDKNGTVFANTLNDVTLIKYMEGMNGTNLDIRLSDGKKYLISATDWNNPKNRKAWALLCLAAVILGSIGVFIVITTNIRPFFVGLVLMPILFFLSFLVSSQLKKVPAKDQTSAAITEWPPYLQTICPDKVQKHELSM